MKLVIRILLVILVVFAGIVFFNYSKLNIITGYAAKNLASTVYLTNRTEASVEENDHQVPMIELAESDVDSEKKAAFSKVFGLMKREAVYREGLGAVLTNDDYETDKIDLKPNRSKKFDSLPYPFGHLPAMDTVLANVDYEQLQKAVNLVFENPDKQRTRTFMVLYKGHLLTEKYVDGFTKDTPVLGWSMTKSVLATCYGILQHQGKIDLESSNFFSDWENDDRKNITINHLLRMQSGLEWDEDYGAMSDVTEMLFMESDMPKVAREKKAIAKPVEIWNYSSGTTNLLSGLLRDQFDSHQAYLDFPYKELVDKIGMHSMIIEADIVGNYVGSSYGWASTRDWGKFGQLYLDRGNWNGEQLFSSAWVDYITKPTAHSDGEYGAHFWLNAGGKFPDVPKDMYSCNGYQGQHVYIIPSKDLVVVRTGLAEYPEFDVNKVLSEVIKAIN